jgi:uncharacterized protein YcfJ
LGLLILVPCALSDGCSSMSNTDKGVLGGGAIGAGTGAIIGHAAGNTAAGALIGAGVGAVSGGLIGNAVDKSEEKAKAEAIATQQARQSLGIHDVIQMAQQHISDDIIIGQIRTSPTIFRLNYDEIVLLKQNGVSDVVIHEMQNTAYRVPRRVYVVDPAPPPPVSVGVGFGYGHRW